MTGSLCGYLAPAVNAEEENNISYPNNMSASSWFAGKSKETKKQGRKAPSGQLRSAPTGDVTLNNYITDVTASGTTKIEDNLYQATVKLQFEIDTARIEAVTSAGYKFVYDSSRTCSTVTRSLSWRSHTISYIPTAVITE